MKTYVIAEIGVNHSGQVDLAKKMIDSARECGADAVKFQTFKAETLVGKNVPKVPYQLSTTDKSETHYEMIRKLEFSYEDHFPVYEHCKNIGIDFISTPYDIESAKFLNDQLGVNCFKVASADIVDIFLHEYLASVNKKIIIATGMANLGEIEQALRPYKDLGTYSNVSLLHCVSNYPCAHESLNLRSMLTLRDAFNLEVGYSDHSIGSLAAAISVAMGAKIIEKHFTLDKKMQGPDHKASSDPAEFKELINTIRLTEKSLGSPIKECRSEEYQMSQISRKSLTWKTDLPKNTIISKEHLTFMRPGNGLNAKFLSNIIGKKLLVNAHKSELVKLSDMAHE